MATISSTSQTPPILVFLLLLLLNSTQTQSSTWTNQPHRSFLGRGGRSLPLPQIPSCSDMVNKSQCTHNPNCRWCTSEALDDMCFSKSEAWRLPHQVFIC